jgi:hypothetical protein
LYFWITLLFILIQIPLSFRNSLFMDEGTYITAGMRLLTTLQNEGWGSWFSGSPFIAPVLYGAGYLLAGDVGARMVAALFMGMAIYFFAKATDIYFGRGAAVFASLFLATNVNIVALGHHGVYDTVAIGFLGVAFWAIAKLHWTNNRTYLYRAAVALTLTALSKFAVGIMIVPLVALLVVLRGWKGLADGAILLAICYVLIVYVYYPIVGKEVLDGFMSTALMHTPSKDVMGVALLHARMAAVPTLLSLVGLVLVWFYRRDRFWLALILVGTLAMWPTYHLYRMITVSQQKHIILGFLFTSPVAGLTLYYLWRKAKVVLVGVMAGIVALTYNDLPGLDMFWADMRSATGYMKTVVKPNALVYTAFGDREMVPALLIHGDMYSPWLFHGKFTPKVQNLCAYHILVLDRPAVVLGGKTYTQDDVSRCGFTRTYFETQKRYGLRGEGRTEWNANIIIYTKH